jgi:two-component system cell cycle response regulator DivK
MSHTILVVDDNEVNLKLAREILILRGYEVMGAHRGEQAIELARQHRPDLVLLDMQLPDVDGLESPGGCAPCRRHSPCGSWR